MEGTTGNLCLSRREGESIVADLGNGERMIITIAECHNSRTRVRITAPLTIPIHRMELIEN